jgi:hypothetical protein
MKTLPAIIAIALLGMATQVHAQGLQGLEAGRAHAMKANELSAAGNCAAALDEFTAAYAALKDPTLLFNRAECYRKVGKNQEAIADYKAFLAQLPTAPNRESVQARIKELEHAAVAPAESTGVAATAAPTEPIPVAPAPATTAPPALALESSSKPMPQFDQPSDTALPMSFDPADSEPTKATPAMDGGTWPRWAWIGVGVVAVAAGGVGVWYGLHPSQTEIPKSDLGNFKF